MSRVAPDRVASLKRALSLWELPEATAIDVLFEQHLFRVSTAEGDLTLKDLGSDPPDRARQEFVCSVLEHLESCGLPVATPIRTGAGHAFARSDGTHYEIYRFVEAEPYPDASEQRHALLFRIGRTLADVHSALATYPDPDVASKTWEEDHAASLDHWVERLCADLPPARSALVNEVSRARVEPLRAALAGIPRQLIHRDFHPGNVLVRDGRVAGLIDNDHLSIGQPVFDLATFAITLIKRSIDDPAQTEAWLADLPHLVRGYAGARPLSPAEARALPHAMLANCLLMAEWFVRMGPEVLLEYELECLGWLHHDFDRTSAALAAGTEGA